MINQRFLAPCLAAMMAFSASAQVYISEIAVNVPGGDTGYEFWELRGTPGLSLAGYYLMSLEGQGTTGKGDINQFFDLGAYSLGANGYLVGVQNNTPYTIAPGATVVKETTQDGWGLAGNSIGYSTDSTTSSDMENSATGILLVRVASGGTAPSVTLDLDTDTDGLLDLPEGWTVVDSVGLLDSVSAAEADRAYGAITFRNGTVGTNMLGNVFTISTETATSLYVARKGETTGSTDADWLGAALTGSAGNFSILRSTEPGAVWVPISDFVLGGPPVPEPSTLALFGCAAALLFLRRKQA